MINSSLLKLESFVVASILQPSKEHELRIISSHRFPFSHFSFLFFVLYLRNAHNTVVDLYYRLDSYIAPCFFRISVRAISLTVFYFSALFV